MCELWPTSRLARSRCADDHSCIDGLIDTRASHSSTTTQSDKQIHPFLYLSLRGEQVTEDVGSKMVLVKEQWRDKQGLVTHWLSLGDSGRSPPIFQLRLCSIVVSTARCRFQNQNRSTILGGASRNKNPSHAYTMMNKPPASITLTCRILTHQSINSRSHTQQS
jgi:hypothetical protein